MSDAPDHHHPTAPTTAAQAWLDLAFGMFVHFGVNTFNDKEWSYGQLDARSFAPTNFDPDQWVAAAKSAGMRYLLLVTKHVDGFCNWRTQWTDYSVASSSFKGDVVEAVADACQRADLKLALYYCLWDPGAATYDDDAAYALYVKRQWVELMTKFGPIVELWVDGGWKKGGLHRFGEERWRWRELYETVKSIQPDCMVGVNGTTDRPGEIVMWPCDFRIGEKRLPPADQRLTYWCDDTEWWLPFELDDTLTVATGRGLFPDGNWFWHEGEQDAKPAQQIVDTLQLCLERNANFVLNVGPTSEGRLREIDVDRLQHVGRLIQARTLTDMPRPAQQ